MSGEKGSTNGGAQGRPTPDDVARTMGARDLKPVIERLAAFVGQNEEFMGDLLALLAVAAFSKDKDAAEGIYINTQSALMPFMFCTVNAADIFVHDTLAALKGEHDAPRSA